MTKEKVKGKLAKVARQTKESPKGSLKVKEKVRSKTKQSEQEREVFAICAANLDILQKIAPKQKMLHSKSV